MLTVGPRSACAYLRFASTPSRLPTSCTSSGFHVAPSALPHGKFAEGRPDHCSPRAPLGPSVTFNGGTPRRSTPGPCHRSTPATTAAFSSSVMSATSFSMRSLMPGILCHHAAMEQLHGKVAVVTGAGSGIGRALVRRLAAEQMRVVAADIEAAALAETVDGLVGTSTFIADVADFRDVDAMAEHAYETFGATDV